MKIQVIGFSGSGKSTLAGELAEKLQLPVMYLDTVFWLPGWEMRPREEQSQILSEFLKAHPEGWVIDGNYSKNHYDERMEAADRILFLNFNRFLCLYRILKRRIMYRNRTRDSITEGCDEKIDFAFVKWAFWDSRTRKAKAKFRTLRERYPDKLIELRSPKAVEAYMKTFCS